MKINNANKFNKLLILLVLISPVFSLTVEHLTNLVVLVLFVSCLYRLIAEEVLHSPLAYSRGWRQIICGMFVAPLAAIVISQSLRFDFYSPNWDGPLRLVLCIPIFLAVANGDLRANPSKSISQIWLTLIFPVVSSSKCNFD